MCKIQSIDDFNKGRILPHKELDLLKEDSFYIFKNLDSMDYIEVSTEEIKFEGDFTL